MTTTDDRDARQAAYLAQLEEERQAEAQRRAALPVLAGEIGAAIGEGWTAADPHPDYPGCEIHGPDGARLFVRYEGYREGRRLEISGSYPDGTRDATRAEHFRITVAASKSARAIAGDVTRRLLPQYLPELARVREEIDAHNAATDKRGGRLAELAEILGVEVPRPRYEGAELPDRVHMPHNVKAHGSISVNYYGESASIDLGSVPWDQVVRIAAILAGRA